MRFLWIRRLSAEKTAHEGAVAVNLKTPRTTRDALVRVVAVRGECDLDRAGVVQEADDVLVGGGGGAGYYVFQDATKCRESCTVSSRQPGVAQ